MLRHDLSRVTPFPAQALFWRWDGRPKSADRSRTDIVLTMVPKMAVAAALETLTDAGIAPSALEVDTGGQRLLLPMAERDGGRSMMRRSLAWGCAGLAVVALILPFLLQTLALHTVNADIAELQPTVTQVEASRRGMTAGNAGREVMARERADSRYAAGSGDADPDPAGRHIPDGFLPA
jgi:general secretion pathway protein L